MSTPPTWGPLRSFGRIKSRTLKPRQAALMETLLPQIAVPDPAAGPIDPRALMPDAKAVWFEVGFGGGEHMAEQAARHPDVLIVGCEPFQNGVGSALRHVEERELTNVRLHMGDARDVLAAFPDASLERVFVLFPDPWPKARHHKRRVIQQETLTELARVLKPGGRFRFVTDWKDYAAWTLERALKEPAFRWPAEKADHWKVAPADHVTTRYQEKLLGDTQPIYLEFERV
ncbi:tRNA (guanosine(46)-N7)-methyltransferase TrmB [Caulobacter sp. 17J80-11]|uniref:tRNA (guanosine(46)-N7)-methyltransferase TrmB n=1 Tax=Caulobacter sp. 17J80-11 TaxID=2763502 RepID=UPI0016537E91|nr:tRNA (guanosine(46)-N7)-methyltransferase TrmB [Caulobacter sp. 17J80-11]MBC6983312.1 tRNA (guanosine(46)-N7)-methyltransferase TrmB [Caulobacter sp. 17J80-11]